MKLTKEQVAALQSAYSNLDEYDSEGELTPFDPVSYRAPDGDHLIHIAALRGDIQTVEILLNAGEDVNAIGDMGNTPAHCAAAGGWRTMFDFLMQNGADQSIKNGFGNAAGDYWAKPSHPDFLSRKGTR